MDAGKVPPLLIRNDLKLTRKGVEGVPFRTAIFAVQKEQALKYMKQLLSSIFVVVLVLGNWASASAQTEITLRTPLPTKDSFEKILPGFEAKTGYKVNASYGNGVGTKQEAAKGDPYDVFVILPPYPDALASGNLDNKSKTTLGSFVLALTVKKGSPRPDISTADSVKKALLSAKSLVTVDPTQGSVGVATGAAIQKLGIADQVKGKIKYVPNGGGVGQAVSKGEVEIGLGPYVSDLISNRNADLEVVGGLPAGASTPTEIDAFISTKAKDPKAARALLQYLVSPEAEAVYKSLGILPAH
jgi:molybdate transport system substrate-binding protein